MVILLACRATVYKLSPSLHIESEHSYETARKKKQCFFTGQQRKKKQNILSDKKCHKAKNLPGGKVYATLGVNFT